MVTDTSAVTLTVSVTNPSDTAVTATEGSCPIAIVVIADADTLVPAFEDGPPCWPAADVELAAGGAVGESREWTGRVADWEFGNYPHDGIATLRLMSDAMLLDDSAVTTQLLIAPIARIEASITIDSVFLPWAPKDIGFFEVVLWQSGGAHARSSDHPFSSMCPG